jgi:hypothetical protein
MRVVRQGREGGPHDDLYVYRCIGDFGISVFQRPGRHYRPEAPSLNRSKIAGTERVPLLAFDRIDVDRTATQGCRTSWLGERTAGFWTGCTAFRRDRARPSALRSALRRYRLLF